MRGGSTCHQARETEGGGGERERERELLCSPRVITRTFFQNDPSTSQALSWVHPLAGLTDRSSPVPTPHLPPAIQCWRADSARGDVLWRQHRLFSAASPGERG